ncbi:MAG: hypothetical protein CL424_20015 [Acidimicrobiaceae bacterium]|nr:hypothetical protein [Acidimicrobiaceae bacterium]
MSTPTDARSTTSSTTSSLRHVLVVGGTLAEWSALTDEAWQQRLERLGELCEQLGVAWLTIRAYEHGEETGLTAAAPPVHRRHPLVHGEVIADPQPDGRRRFAEAMQRIAPDDEVNEATVAAALYEPADSEPDLVVVLGPPTQLPPSLVWELAYAELVFIDVAWADLTADDVAAAIDDFSNRRRRFGGLDE